MLPMRAHTTHLHQSSAPGASPTVACTSRKFASGVCHCYFTPTASALPRNTTPLPTYSTPFRLGQRPIRPNGLLIQKLPQSCCHLPRHTLGQKGQLCQAAAPAAAGQAADGEGGPGGTSPASWQLPPLLAAALDPGGGSAQHRSAQAAAAAAWQALLGAAGCTATALLLACRAALLSAAGCTACTAAAVLLALHLTAFGSPALASIDPSTTYSGYDVTLSRSASGSETTRSGSGSGDLGQTQIRPPSSSSGSALIHASGSGSGSGSAPRSGSWRGDVASETEDKLLELVRQVETRVGSAVGSVTTILEGAEASPSADVAAHALISEVWEVVDQNYLDARGTGFDRGRWAALRDGALGRQYGGTPAAYRAVREMLAWGLSDPYCRFVPPDELAAMKKYDVTGVGLNLGTAEEYVRKTGRPLPSSGSQSGGVYVVGISKGSAADVGGIQQGDEVLQVDGKEVLELSPFQASSLIQGVQQGSQQQQQPPSQVGIKVRKPDGSSATKSIPRPVKTISSPLDSRLVKAGMLRPETTGLLRLSSFNARAHRDLAAAISQLEEAGAQSLVLDLRDNRGGLVSEGLEVARLFLQPGSPIVVTESRTSAPAPTSASPAAAALPTFDTIPMASGPPLTSLPLTLLVNDHTASAAEIVAGALKDNCRAVLVGGQTYGKGLIQSVYELSDGSGMVITVGKYLTPSRIDIDRYGIRPNFTVQPTGEEFSQALNACRLSKEHDVLLELAAAGLQQRQGP